MNDDKTVKNPDPIESSPLSEMQASFSMDGEIELSHDVVDNDELVRIFGGERSALISDILYRFDSLLEDAEDLGIRMDLINHICSSLGLVADARFEPDEIGHIRADYSDASAPKNLDRVYAEYYDDDSSVKWGGDYKVTFSDRYGYYMDTPRAICVHRIGYRDP